MGRGEDDFNDVGNFLALFVSSFWDHWDHSKILVTYSPAPLDPTLISPNLNLTHGRIGTSPKTWIDPRFVVHAESYESWLMSVSFVSYRQHEVQRENGLSRERGRHNPSRPG